MLLPIQNWANTGVFKTDALSDSTRLRLSSPLPLRVDAEGDDACSIWARKANTRFRQGYADVIFNLELW